MTVSDFIAKYLYSQGVDCVFEMIGGMTVRLIDAIYRHGGIEIVSMHHEQAAAFAACGWAQIKHIPGVALATSGPGATNLITGIATAYFDSIPAVFITGQVNQSEMKNGRACRQMGFQEMDVVSVVKPITKYAVQLECADDIMSVLPQAFETALNGRPGPVLIDIPMNLQKEELADFNEINSIDIPTTVSNVLTRQFCASINVALAHSKRPLFLLGGGVIQSQSENLVQQLLEKTHIPSVYSLHGKGILPTSHKYLIGLIGSYGNRWANKALYESDLLIILGSRLDVRQTGADTVSFAQNKRIFQVDIDKAELNNRVEVTQYLHGDLRDVLNDLCENINEFDSTEWLREINTHRAKWPDTEELVCGNNINPNQLFNMLGAVCNDKVAGFTTDVGANQIWCTQSLALHKNQFYLTSGGMGAMGYALPTAIGASIAVGNAQIVAVAGDGGIQCNIQELEVVARLKLPIKILVLNNHSLGMVRQFQEEYQDKRYPGTVLTYGAPDFVNIASAYGIASRRLADTRNMANLLDWFINIQEPALLDVEIATESGIYPKMQFGHQLNDMYPLKENDSNG